jgi:ATP-dependent DNA helicase RecG
MTEETLRELIAGGETATVEFKSSATRPIEVAVRMCGMANNRAGGIIIFGIEDASRAIIGIRNPSLTHDVVLRAARMIKPAVPLGETSVLTWTIDGCTLLTVEIPPNSGRLYQYDGACYVRRGTNTIPLSVEEIGAYLNAYGASRWELALTRNATIEDIDTEAVERYLGYRAEKSQRRRRHSSLSQLLLGLDAAAGDAQSGEEPPTNAGMLMFGYDPQLYLPQSEVVCIKYADPLGVRHYIDRKNYHGTLPELIDQASGFLRQYIWVGATIRGFYREDEPEYPYEAIREAVVNAVVHRDYSRSGETVRVFMFPDRVKVRSPGGLLPGITLDDLVAMRVTSNPRNQVLAGFLRDIPGYMERVGSGVRFMIQEMREMGLPDPEFSEHFDFMVVFRNGLASADQEVDLNERQQIALRIIREKGSISSGEYRAATGASERTALRELREMVDRGIIVSRGKTRGLRYFLP